MPEIEVDNIKVRDRVRKDFGDINGLSISIQKYGLLHPICITKDLELVAGERRLRAHKMLGLKTIEVKYLEDLNDLEKKEIEVEENIARKNFSWQEEVTAKLDLDQLKRLMYGSAVKGHASNHWGIKDTAVALQESVGGVSMDLALAEGLTIYPQLRKEKSKTAAFTKFKQLRRSALRRELAQRHVTKPVPFIHQGDCVPVMKKKIPDESISLIVTDPQYGIQLGPQSSQQSFTDVYMQDDTEYRVMEQLDLALIEMERVLKQGCHLYIFFAALHYTVVKRLLEKHFIVGPTPIIWYKEQRSNPGSLTQYANCYESCFFCSKGKPRDLYAWNKNLVVAKGVPGDRRIHPTEKPPSLLRVFIKASSLPGDTVLDPYAGSGSTGEAAISVGRKTILIDIDERYYQGMLDRFEKHSKGG